jgi:ribonuclease III
VLVEPQLAGDQAAVERNSLTEHLGWHVSSRDLFMQALAHRSWCAEHPGKEPNERLEFLGDAVLGLIVTDYLYRSYPDLPEGELAKARAAVVNSASLASTARELQLGNALLLGKGEDASGGRLKPSILADAMEALIGAIYLDAGYAVTDRIVLNLLEDRLREAARGPGEEDYKTRLQELCAQTYDELPVYRITDKGPDHAKVFEAEVVVGGRPRGRGEGRSKKQAEQVAARHGWYALTEAGNGGLGTGADGAVAGGADGAVGGGDDAPHRVVGTQAAAAAGVEPVAAGLEPVAAEVRSTLPPAG